MPEGQIVGETILSLARDRLLFLLVLDTGELVRVTARIIDPRAWNAICLAGRIPWREPPAGERAP